MKKTFSYRTFIYLWTSERGRERTSVEELRTQKKEIDKNESEMSKTIQYSFWVIFLFLFFIFYYEFLSLSLSLQLHSREWIDFFSFLFLCLVLHVNDNTILKSNKVWQVWKILINFLNSKFCLSSSTQATSS